MKYKDYLKVDKSYFPCIDEEAINAGAEWRNTYPHETFIQLLKDAVDMLDGNSKRSLWISGAYGTGKSQCAYALRKILDSKTPESEVTGYWNRYDPLKENPNLLEKILGHRENKIVTVFRYSVSTASSINTFFTIIQESIRRALIDNGCSYLGQNSQKDSAIKWLEKSEANRNYIDSNLSKAEWRTIFTQSSADEILRDLKSGKDVTDLMDHLSQLSDEEEIRAFRLDSDILVNWIKDVVNKNGIKLVFVWDEFSDFFRRYSGYMEEFQKVVQICQSTPFYFVIVTHPISSLVGSNDESAKIVRQRFTQIEIQLPDTVAFDLIGQAFTTENDAKDKWESTSKELMERVHHSTDIICNSLKIKKDAIKKMLPIHPMTALALKNIATAFQSNQRSMFDFIKSNYKDDDEQSFQWFIGIYGPDDSSNIFLTVDMLWDYFYERGKQYLSIEIRNILGVFDLQKGLSEDERRVLKTVLILNAISTRLGNAQDILRPTDQNISYCYEGIDYYETAAKNIAKRLADKKILRATKVGNGNTEYGVAIYAGDSENIDKYKENLLKIINTDYLVNEGDKISQAVELTYNLSLRFAENADTGALKVATKSNFISVIDGLFRKSYTYNFRCVLAVAKDEAEAVAFRTLIKETVSKEKYKGLIVIDALNAPLGVQNMEDYAELQARSQYYQSSNHQQARDDSQKAKDILNVNWRKNVRDCQFVLFSYDLQTGTRCYRRDLLTILENIVRDRYPNVLDFNPGLTESHLKATKLRQSAECGLSQSTAGLIKGCEKAVLGKVWNVDNYWSDAGLQSLPIVKIKNGVDRFICDKFDKDGKVEIGDVYSYLQTEHGFSPCNMSAFVFGFLLKEYSVDPYRYMDANGLDEQISPYKISEMIASCMGSGHKGMFIAKISPEEKYFYEVTEKIWGVSAANCSSPSSAATLVCEKIKSFGYPIWCLEDSYNAAVCELLNLYMDFIKAPGSMQQELAAQISRVAKARPEYIDGLHDILTAEKCKSAMELFLNSYKGGELLNLARDISAIEQLYADIRKIFGDMEYSALWEKETGLKEIDRLTVKYSVIKTSDDILGTPYNGKIEDVCDAWKSRFKFMGLSCEGLISLYPELNGILGVLRDEVLVVDGCRISSEKMSVLNDGLTDHKDELRKIVGDSLLVFKELYSDCLSGYTDVEVENIRGTIHEDLSLKSKAESLSIVSRATENYDNSLSKNRIKELWTKLTDSKSPIDWSNIHQTPILCVVSPSMYDGAKKAFETVNFVAQSKNIDGADIDEAIEFMNSNSGLFDGMMDPDFVDRCFRDKIIGEYSALLPDLNFVRDKLGGIGIDAYSWYDNPRVKSLVEDLALDVYENGGREKIMKDVDSMPDSELKAKVLSLISSDMEFGLKIMKDGGE